MVSIGQEELRAIPEDTNAGRKRQAVEVKEDKDIQKAAAVGAAEAWAKDTMPPDYKVDADYSKKRVRTDRNIPFQDKHSTGSDGGMIGLSSTGENDNNVFNNISNLIAAWEAPPPPPANFARAIEAMENVAAQNAHLMRVFQQGQPTSATSDDPLMTTPASNRSEIVKLEKSCTSCTSINGIHFVFCSGCGKRFD
jgi:hypothetical protein